MYSAKDQRRFWVKTTPEPGGCIEWTGSTYPSGYGSFWDGKKVIPAHRFAYELAFGLMPDDLPGVDFRGPCVMHSCDNRRCVNFEHLSVGSHQQNMDDMAIKGRRASLPGEANPRAKLTGEQVAEIRRLKGVESQRSLGARFGVSKTAVGMIQRGTHWREFPHA